MNEWGSGKMRTQKLKAKVRAPTLLSDVSFSRASLSVCTMGTIAPIHCVRARMK